MITNMIKRLQTYEVEALQCDAIIVATVLNPRLRMKFFELHHPSKVTHVQRVMDRYIDTYSIQYQARLPAKAILTVQQDLTVADDEYNVFSTIASGPHDDTEQEMEGYLSGKFPLNGGTFLRWWKVCVIVDMIIDTKVPNHLFCFRIMLGHFLSWPSWLVTFWHAVEPLVLVNEFFQVRPMYVGLIDVLWQAAL
jgi:hypothetical protein